MNDKVKIWHISDTHGYHSRLQVPQGIDLVIHSGDAGNYRDPYRCEPEVRSFANWFASLNIPNKVYVAGNHDSAVEHLLIDKKFFDMLNINYLFNDSIEILGLKLWGSPFTPQFGMWSFMKNRSKLNKLWENIPEDTDILITHGPAKHYLDTSENRDGSLEACGDSALGKHIRKRNIKLHCFGHIHNMEDIKNSGVFKPSAGSTLYSNASCVTDRKFGKYMSHGNQFEFDLSTRKLSVI